METTEPSAGLRPNLQPLWTNYDGFRRSSWSRRRLHSPGLSSPRSPLSLPSPLHPRPSISQDSAMRKHERAIINSFDQGPKITLPGMHALSPITEQTSTSASRKTSPMPISTPVSAHPSPSTSEQLASSPTNGRRQTMVAQTRSILLAGLPQLQARHVGSSMDRRQSLPALMNSPKTPSPADRRSMAMFGEQLDTWGQIFFVAAVSLRRTSEGVQAEPGRKASQHDTPPHLSDTNRVVVRARVMPCTSDRKPFMLQRTFDLAELRSTIPESSPLVEVFRNGSPVLDSFSRRSSLSSDSLPSPLESGRLTPLSATCRWPRTSISHSPRHTPHRYANTVAIQLGHARTHLPMLAALMMSGHVREGDVIYLPIPQPTVWAQTVAYVHTGKGELTEAIKENIVYLGGKA